MTKGISIHVGINRVKSTNFAAPPLKGCEEDAKSMFRLAQDRGFLPGWINPATGAPSPMLGKDATYDNVVNAIRNAAAALNDPGDIFLFTFAGHGSQRVTPAGIEEPDGRDETVLLFDHMLLDNVWRGDLWPRFRDGIRAVAVADCCNSASVLFALDLTTAHLATEVTDAAGNLSSLVAAEVMTVTSRPWRNEALETGLAGSLARQISEVARTEHLGKFKAFYDEKLAALPAASPEISASILLLSACRDDEKALDGIDHGAFTRALLEVWDSGHFSGAYAEFMNAISGKFVGTNQHPVLTVAGKPNEVFSQQKPFTI